MSSTEDASRLEALFPQVISALFHSGEADPLRHHSVAQVRLMRLLMSGSKTASELSFQLGLSPSSLTQMASRMISAGLISKELDSVDRRVRQLSLTPAGRELMSGRQSMRADAAAKLLASMDPEHVKLLIELLEEVVAHRSNQSFT